ncbi:MAG: SHOCT domain-containing protein [Lentisphaeria bacterium]|nr:SHOCT domain-containing protein [Candidatus Neomarinimicrobiota bacterium]MCF7842964.1 SHOCT domain-containing protein [Lentisphaeria bacterium]
MMFSHGWFGGMMGWGILFWIVIILLLIWVVKTLVGRQETSPTTNDNGNDNAEAILRKRYARGEISREEFEQMKNDLRR